MSLRQASTDSDRTMRPAIGRIAGELASNATDADSAPRDGGTAASEMHVRTRAMFTHVFMAPLLAAMLLAVPILFGACGQTLSDESERTVSVDTGTSSSSSPTDRTTAPSASPGPDRRLETGYQRMFMHDGSDFTYAPFEDAVRRAASVTVSRLTGREETGEGYAILTYAVEESLYNPDGDAEIHVYERDGLPMPAVEPGTRQLLVLSRATNVYYPHPYFHNFNGILVAQAPDGSLECALTGETEPVPGSDLGFSGIVDDVRTLLAAADPERAVYRYAGYEADDGEASSLIEQSPVIVTAAPVRTVFRNRHVDEVVCRVSKTWKGVAEAEITVLLPSGHGLAEGEDALLFLIADGEYRVTSRHSIVRRTDAAAWDAVVVSLDRELAGGSGNEPLDAPAPTPDASREVRAEFRELVERNQDVRGRITIAGTVIDYPLLQSTDNNKYLSIDIDGKASPSGCIVLDYRVDVAAPGRNTPIYGHNMKRGTQFHSLVEYKKEDFFRSHRLIRLDTLYETSWWSVYSVSVVDSSYNYVITMNFADDDEYRTFLDDTVARSMWPVLAPPTVDDQIMTLVTCSYEFDGARTIIHAKRLRALDAGSIPAASP